jgi:hypothetical protein
MAIKERRKTGDLQPRDKLLGKIAAVPSRIRDKDFELLCAAASVMGVCREDDANEAGHDFYGVRSVRATRKPRLPTR